MLFSVGFACSKTETQPDCTSLIQKVQSAAQTYASNPSNTANCNAYKSALQEALKCSGTNTSQYQSALNQLTCK